MVLVLESPAPAAEAMAWAAGNLLRREWSVDRQLLQAKAQQALAEAVTRLRAGGRSADPHPVQAANDLAGEGNRVRRWGLAEVLGGAFRDRGFRQSFALNRNHGYHRLRAREGFEH